MNWASYEVGVTIKIPPFFQRSEMWSSLHYRLESVEKFSWKKNVTQVLETQGLVDTAEDLWGLAEDWVNFVD